MKKLLLITFIFITHNLTAQITATTKSVTISGVSVINPRNKPTSFAPLLKSLEAPKPGGKSYSNFINKQKQKSATLFPVKNQRSTSSTIYGNSPDPVKVKEMGMRSYIAQIDLEGIYTGGTPLDNTICMSNNYLLASVNTFLWAYDIIGDSNLFVDEKGSTYNISFTEFGKDYIKNPGTESPFDPKLAYIPKYDKYVFTFLSGRTSTDSKIIIGFSTSNDPRDPWNVYMLPGNPRGLNQWTDFPMFGFDKNDIYYSINILRENASWQEGFEGSIIWQIPMEEGFNGNSALNTTMYDDILYNGTKIRNLTPVQPADSASLTKVGMTFLSNRNFDIQNDSLFYLDIDKEKKLTIKTIQLPTPYGMPPNGIQADDDPNDLTDGLQTNDSRFLGATRYYNSQGDLVTEFVGNTKDFNTGRAGVYHGILKESLLNSGLEVFSNTIGVDSLDFGYPNIAYVNNGKGCYEGTLIAFNHTSFSTNAGISAIRHSNNLDSPGYSNIIRLKEGDGPVKRINGSYERWGDYFGIQTVPSRPNEVYTAGFYGTSTNSSSTWFNHLMVSESNIMAVNIDQTVTTDLFIKNSAFIDVSANYGYEPYTFNWSDGSIGNRNQIDLFITNSVTISDSKGCQITEEFSPINLPSSSPLIFPNPTLDRLCLTFTVSYESTGSFGIYDLAGQLIKDFGNLRILKGDNEFTISTRPLLPGNYILIIKDDTGNNITQQSFIKL